MRLKQQLFIFSLLILFTGCAISSADPTPTVFTPVINPAATLLTPTESIKVEPTSMQNDVKCDDSGTIQRYQIDSTFLDGPLYFSVYFPPCYQEEPAPAYPVLYALHGQNFNDMMWVDLGAAEITDRLILEEELLPFLIVMPYEEFFFRGADVNNFPAALQQEIIPFVEQSFNVCIEKECRAIGGISRGASWAMRIGLELWDLFGAIGAHSLPTFRGDITNLPLWLDEVPFGEEPRIFLDTGRFDPEVKSAYRFENILSQKGIPHAWHLNEGRHNEAYWREHMETYLRWYSEGWK